MLQIKNLSKAYKTKGGVVTRALDDVSVDFPEKGLVFLLGKSGSGKSTLLNMIGGLDRPDSGEIIVKGRSSKDFSQSDFDSYRNTYVGFIFQEYNVLNEFNIEQNIALALQLQGKKNDKAAVDALLKEVDLEGFNKRKPNTLSGGQKQRIAIARALIKDPEIIMADEPTGALDSATGKQVLEILKKLSETKLVIIVSHDQDFAEEYGNRIIELKDGKIISDKTKEFVAPKTLNENVTVVNENVIDIKEAGKLSEADFKEIYKLLKKQKGEVLISSGESTVQASKKAARIGESNHSEVFADTQKVDLKEYNGSETKFIRSRMPFARALKMGASGLKTKPIRLTFTVLLSVVSMTLFGVASTLMLYRPSYSLSNALANCERTSEAINKSYNFKSRSVTIDNATGDVVEEGSEWDSRTSTYFGKGELDELNAKTNNKFAGVYNYYPGSSVGSGNYRLRNVTMPVDSGDYYSAARSFSGMSDASPSWLSENGFSIHGKAPSKDNEIAISNYVYDFLKASGSYGSISTYNDLLGKTLEFENSYYGKGGPNKLTIAAVYDFGPLPSKYDSLKEAKPATQSDDDRRKELSTFQSVIENSIYTTGFVSPEYIDKYCAISSNKNDYLYSVNPEGVMYKEQPFGNGQYEEEIDRYSCYDTFVLFDDMDTSAYTFYDHFFEEIEVSQLSDSEILLPYDYYYQEYANNKYSFSINNLLNAARDHDGSDPAFIQFMDDYQSDDPQTDVVKAMRRLSEAMNNGWRVYEDGYSLDEDQLLVTTELKKFVSRGYGVTYLKTMTSLIENHINSNGGTAPDGWGSEEMVALRDSLYSGPFSDTQMATLKNKYQAIIEADSNMAYIPAVTFVEGPLYMISSSYDWEYLDSLCRDSGYDGYYEMISAIQDAGYSSNGVNTIKRIGKDLFKHVYGTDLADSDFSSFFAGINLLEPKYRSESSLPEHIYSKDYAGTTKTYTVKAFYKSKSDNGSWGKVINRSAIKQYLFDSYSWKEIRVTDYVEPTDARYSFLLAVTRYSQSDIDLFTENHGSYYYAMSNDIYLEVSFWTDMIGTLSTVFLIVGGVTGVLAGLLLLNFISVSIASKSKDIGILRAVGARGSDVFKIFYSESSIIAGICFILSVIGTGIVCFLMNREMVNSLLGVPLLEFGILNIGLILGVSIVFSFIATFLPVMLAAKKPPVEAIRSL